MSRAHKPWTFFRGDTWQITDVMCDIDDNPLDLSNSGAEVIWSLNGGDGYLINYLTLKSSTGEITMPNDGTDGVVVLNVSPTDSTHIPPGIYKDQFRLYVQIDNLVAVQTYGVITVLEPLGSSAYLSRAVMNGSSSLTCNSTVVGP